MAFRILDLPECNIFSSMAPDMFRVIREGIIRCILATDMARHNEILAQFKEAVVDGFDFTNKTHVNLVSNLHLSLLIYYKTTFFVIQNTAQVNKHYIKSIEIPLVF